MKFHCIAGILYFCGTVALSATPLDDKVKAFEDAVKSSPPAKIDSSTYVSPLSPLGRALAVRDLEAVMQRGDNEASIERIVTELMATHSSGKVQQTGDDLVQELEAERKARAAAFEAKADAVLAEAPDAVTRAKKASDLDGILKELQALQDPRGGSFGDYSTQATAGKINATFQFVTQWQDYLSASGSGNMQEAQNSLRNILNNRQIDASTFFPRSELLARLVEASGGNPRAGGGTPGTTVTDPDVILDKVKTVEDVEGALNQLLHFSNPSQEPLWDWSELATLDKARDDALAGLPVTLDLKQAIYGPVWGGTVSRIVAMELLVLLPHYFGTQESDPPKANETVSAYLDRLGATANTSGNLAVLQRVIGVQVALADSSGNNPRGMREFMDGPAPKGTQYFSAGLSQEASEQYVPAVISYEKALKEPDHFLPVKIVGERLAAIKAAHPDEFEMGLTIFLTPTPIIPFWMRDNPLANPYANNPNLIIRPIPMTISIPSRATAPAETGPPTNAAPVNPVSPPVAK
jgi:hypothetical protein